MNEAFRKYDGTLHGSAADSAVSRELPMYSRFNSVGVMHLMGRGLQAGTVADELEMPMPTLLFPPDWYGTTEAIVTGTAIGVPVNREDILWSEPATIDMQIGERLHLQGISKYLRHKKIATYVSIYLPELGDRHPQYVEGQKVLPVGPGVCIATHEKKLIVDGIPVMQSMIFKDLRMLTALAAQRGRPVSADELMTGCAVANTSGLRGLVARTRRYIEQVLPAGYTIETLPMGHGGYYLRSPE